jgi:hypothetical protein
MSGLSDLKEAEQELEKVEEMLAMAERAIQVSRLEQERLSSDLTMTAAVPERAGLKRPG